MTRLAYWQGVAFAAVITMQPVSAQEMSNVYMLDGGAFTNALMANSLVQRMDWAMAAAGQSAPARKVPEPRSISPRLASLSFRPVVAIDTPHDMARAYPPAKRAEAEALFRQLLATFAQVERKFGQPRRDLPTAVALFVTTSHEAATGTDVPESYGPPLIRQLRANLTGDPAIAGASDADKQRLYEQLAIIGMMTGGTTLALKERPDPVIAARLKVAGAGYLQQFLKIAPSRIRFTPTGITISASRR
jgi:hypothetical protein